MTVEMSNIQITNILNALDEFVAKDKEVPIELSFAISKNVKELIKQIEPFEEQRNKLLAKLKEIEAKGDTEELNQTKAKTDIEFDKLANIKVEVSVFTVKFDTIKEISGLSTKDFMALEFMVED